MDDMSSFDLTDTIDQYRQISTLAEDLAIEIDVLKFLGVQMDYWLLQHDRVALTIGQCERWIDVLELEWLMQEAGNAD